MARTAIAFLERGLMATLGADRPQRSGTAGFNCNTFECIERIRFVVI